MVYTIQRKNYNNNNPISVLKYVSLVRLKISLQTIFLKKNSSVSKQQGVIYGFMGCFRVIRCIVMMIEITFKKKEKRPS